MLHRIWKSFIRDNIINFRNGFFLVTAAAALLYLVLVAFLLPEQNQLKPELVIVDNTSNQLFQQYAEKNAQGQNIAIFQTRDELKNYLQEQKNSIGVLLEEGNTTIPQYTLFFQGHENEKARQLLALSMEEELAAIYDGEIGQEINLETIKLRTSADENKIPFNKLWIPVFLFSDAAMIGLLFIGVQIFMEKSEGTVRAYLVSPGRIWEFIFSKGIAIALMNLIFILILVLPALGTGPNYLELIVLMVVSSFTSTMLGALIAVHFENISQFFFPMVAVIFILTIPAIAYFVPSFSPDWIRYFPTYPMVFGFREALFPTGNSGTVWGAVGQLTLLSIVFLLAASWAFKKQIAEK